MKKNILTGSILVSFVIIMLFGSCGGNNASIKGSLANTAGQTLYLEELNVAVRKVVDSVKLKDKGTFSFTYKFTKNEPCFLILRADSLTLATLLVEKGEKIQYNADIKQPLAYTISGSEGSVLVKDLNDSLMATMVKFEVLKKKALALETVVPNAEQMHEVNLEMGSLMAKHKRSLIRFIITNPKSFASFRAIYQKIDNAYDVFGKNEDILYYRTLIDSLTPLYPKSPYVQILTADYEEIENTIKLQGLFDNVTETDLVDVELTNDREESVKLSSVQSKVILIDFWATQSADCLMNNKELQEIYQKYHARGLEVYQICEDDSKDKWLETISNQNLSWINVIDSPESRAARAYNVTSVPSNYLITKSGDFLGKNLYGADLEKKLNEALR